MESTLFMTFFIHADPTVFEDGYPVLYKLEDKCDFILLLTNFNGILDN